MVLIKETGATAARDVGLSEGSTRKDGRKPRKLQEIFGKRVEHGDWMWCSGDGGGKKRRAV